MHDATIFEAMEVDANDDICYDANEDEDSTDEVCSHGAEDANDDICYDADEDEDSTDEVCSHGAEDANDDICYDADEEFSSSVWASIEVDSSVPVSVTICMADLRP